MINAPDAVVNTLPDINDTAFAVIVITPGDADSNLLNRMAVVLLLRASDADATFKSLLVLSAVFDPVSTKDPLPAPINLLHLKPTLMPVTE